MQLTDQIKYLVGKEILLEWRQKYAFNGIVLYIVSTVFVCYLTFKNIIDVPTWNALFWIIMLFASVNAVAKSFLQENAGRQFYIYLLADPQAIILSKIIYNTLLMAFLAIICFLFYSLLIGNLVNDILLFIATLLLGATGFSSVLTMISAIASRTNNNTTLMAILSFPILVPMLIVLIRLSEFAIEGIKTSMGYDYIFILLLMNVIIVTLSYILFPYLWRD